MFFIWTIFPLLLVTRPRTRITRQSGVACRRNPPSREMLSLALQGRISLANLPPFNPHTLAPTIHIERRHLIHCSSGSAS